jgi:hypothetical protein
MIRCWNDELGKTGEETIATSIVIFWLMMLSGRHIFQRNISPEDGSSMLLRASHSHIWLQSRNEEEQDTNLDHPGNLKSCNRGTRLEGPMKTIKIVNKNSRSRGWDSNPITIWNRLLIAKLAVIYLVMWFRIFHGTRRLIKRFTKAYF